MAISSVSYRGPFLALLLAVLLASFYLTQAPFPLHKSFEMSILSPPFLSSLLTRVLPRTTLNTSARAAFISSKPTFTRTFQSQFSTAPVMASKLDFQAAVEHRRTIYALEKKSPISDDRIKEIVTDAVKHTPSSFNSQSTRLVVLLRDEHDKFWDIVRDILKAMVPPENWDHTAQRIAGFRGGYGTILFYEDPEPVKALQTAYATYADKFPVWSEHTSAMHQFNIWTALEAEGFGANLQHYNPLPDQKASEIWNIPLEWSLKAQLVFGQPVEGAREKLAKKEFKPLSDRVFFHGA